jgi:hypothetical protein
MFQPIGHHQVKLLQKYIYEGRIKTANGLSLTCHCCKVKFTLEQATNTQRGSRGIVALLFL